MKSPVLPTPESPLTHATLLQAFRDYLITLGLSAISRKLYLADLTRFFSQAPETTPLLDLLASPSTYLRYLSRPELSSSPTLLRRTLASLRQFGAFVHHTYGLPNPTTTLSLTPNNPVSPLGELADKYIKSFTNYLKALHLEPQSVKSYKSDLTQFLTYLRSHYPSTHLSTLLSEKNLQIYTAELAHSLTQSPATIARKVKTIRRFLAWNDSSTPHVVLSDNSQIPANAVADPHLSLPAPTHSHSPHSSSLPLTPDSPSSPEVSPNSVKKMNYRKLHLPSFRMALSVLTLLLFVATLSIFTYRQFSSDARLTAAFPSTPVTPNRQLSFQGRLENASGTPVTSATNLVFKLYDNSSGGTELYSSGTCSITPDTDGVFSTQIGSTCGSGITSSVFTENANVWLEVTVASETLTPRQQIATVAYALNSETIQGFPISATVSAIRNTVVPMNQWGEIIVGEQSPRLKGVAGTFQISAPALSLVTSTGTNGNITIAPDGTGQVNVTGNTTSTNFFNLSNAQLTTGSLFTGTVANNNSGFKLLDLLSGSSPTSKFSVDSAGNTTLAGTLDLPNSNSLAGVANYTQFSQGISVGGDTIHYIDSNGIANLNALGLTGSLDVYGTIELGDGGDAVTINGSSVTLTGFNCSTNTNGGALTTNGSGVLQCSDDDGGGGGGSSNWRSNLGTLSPLNDTWDLLVGGNATSSAKAGFLNINTGTPTATVSAGTSGAATLTATGILGTTAMQSLTLGNSTTGNILLDRQIKVGADYDLIPLSATGTNDLGSSSIPWDNLYVNSLTLPTFTQGSVLFAGASGVLSQDNSNFYFDDTNNRLGLGLTNPLATLDIAGSASASGTLTFRGSTDPKINILNGENFGLQFSPGGDAGLTERFTVLSNGNVGIGVTNPTNKLEIAGTSSTISNSSGDLTLDSFSGNVVFGTDDDLIPTLGSGSADLGSSSLPWDNLFVSDLDFSSAASTLTLKDNTSSALRILEGANVYLDITTTDNTESFTLNLPVGGATSQTANLFNSNIAKTINLGTGTAADTINIGTGGTTADDINLGGLSTSHVDITGTLNLAGGTTYYVDASGNARFLDLVVADTANPGLTVGNGTTGYAKIGSSTIYDSNTTYLSFDPDSDSSDEMQLTNDGQIQLPTTGSTGGLRLGGDVDLYRSAANELKVDDSATVSANLMVGGQLQLGRFAANPTAIGSGSMIYNSTSNTFQCYNGSTWYNCSGTLYSNTNASVADGSYLTVTHNLASADLLSSAWINSQGVWKSLDASYKPAIAWEGKDTQKGVYHNTINSYLPGTETGASTSTLHDGLVFDTFEDTTKTDSANTTVSSSTQLGDDGSRNYTTLDQRVQGGRVGLMGGQTFDATAYDATHGDNDGQTYLGSNTVNDIYYYDRSKDSTPDVLVELGIDPNWYNGVTLSVATGSANYAQSGTLADKNPNLTPSYNGSLIKATGTSSDTSPNPIFITIKSPTTFDWFYSAAKNSTNVTITPGTAQTLGTTGVSVTFTATNYNVGDVFRVASWYIEAERATRGAKQHFPERSYVIANNGGVDIIDSDTQKLWMRFSDGANSAVRTDPVSVAILNGKLTVANSSTLGFNQSNFATDAWHHISTSGTFVSNQGSALGYRNTGATAYIAINNAILTVSTTVNDVATAVIPNHPTQEVTVSGWGYIVGDTTTIIEESVPLPYTFNTIPQVVVSSGGYGLTTAPTNPNECGNRADTPVGQDAYPTGQTTSSFQANIVRSSGTSSASAYYCYFWTATGEVSPKQFVAVATGATSADGGTTIINETNGTKADTQVGSQLADFEWQNKVAFGNNTLYVASNYDSGADTTWLATYYNIHGLQSESTWAQYRSGYYYVNNSGWTGASSPSILGSASGYNQITSLSATPNTSTNDPSSDTVFVGTTSGVSVINTIQGHGSVGDSLVEAKGSVKYYTTSYISEEMVGDIRTMVPFASTAALSTDTTLGSGDTDVSIKANAFTTDGAGTVPTRIAGVRGKGLSFDGGDYVCTGTTGTCADDADLDISTGTTLTAGVWVYPTSTSATQMILAKWTTNSGFFLRQGTSMAVEFQIGTGSTITLTSSGVMTQNQWNHVVGVRDGSNMYIYINGQLAGSGTSGGSSAITDNANPFAIGAWYNAGSGSQFFTGYLDETFVTATALSSTQVRNMYQVGYRALQSHHSTNLSGGGVDSNQNLAGASNNIGVVAPDFNNQYMYVGSNHTTDGALTQIELNSDTAIKNYDAGDNDPDGGTQIIDDDVNSLAVGYQLEAVGSAASGVKSMGLDNNSTATSGNFVSKTYTLPKNIGSAVIWASPVLDASDGSNTLTVQASNDGGSNYVTCTLVGTDSNPSVPEKEYACTFSTADNDLKVRFQFARGSTKTNTYLVQYGISWLGETGFRVEQADTNNVRLYNFSGESQNLKLNVTGAGTAALASPWTDGGSYLYATGYETLRIYDGSGVNYLGLSHDGTLANFTYNGTTVLSLNSTGDLLPNTDDTQSLGSTTKRWKDLYLGGETMHIGTSLTDEGTISYTTSTNILNFGTDSTSNGDIAFFTDDLYLDKSTGFVGIGDTTPDYLFDVAGTAGFDSTVTITGTLTADGTLDGNGLFTLGDNGDTGAIDTSDWDISTTGAMTGIGAITADGTLTLSGSAANIALGSNYLSGDGGDEGVFVDSSGNVGVGTGSPGTQFEIRTTSAVVPLRIYNNNLDSTEYWSVGPAASDNFVVFNESSTGMYIAHGATSWTANSDERLKTNIAPIASDEGLSALLQLTPVDYNWKNVNASQAKQTGFIAQDVQRLFPGLVSLGETTTITLADGSTETVETPLGVNYTGFIPYIIKGIQEQQAQINNLIQSGIASVASLVTPELKTGTISPLSPDQPLLVTAPVTITSPDQGSDLPTLTVEGEIEATTLSARLAKLNELQVESLTAQNIVADTISAHHIEGLDAKIATLSAGLSDSDFDTISDRIKTRLALLTGNEPSAEDVPVPEENSVAVTQFASDTATSSATLASADIDFATINNYLAVIGQATITTLSVTGDLYSDSLNSQSGTLALQSTGGLINLASNTLLVDSTGQVMVNGDLIVSGRILADSASLNSLELGSPAPASSSSSSSTLGNLLAIYNESGTAVATINASGSANLATLTTNMITIASSSTASESSALSNLTGSAESNATAGVNTLTTPNTELTIHTPFVTPNSLVYLTPTTNTDNKVLFVQSKVTCPPEVLSLDPTCQPSFTVGIDAPASSDISFNWWIIELAPPTNANAL